MDWTAKNSSLMYIDGIIVDSLTRYVNTQVPWASIGGHYENLHSVLILTISYSDATMIWVAIALKFSFAICRKGTKLFILSWVKVEHNYSIVIILHYAVSFKMFGLP